MFITRDTHLGFFHSLLAILNEKNVFAFAIKLYSFLSGHGYSSKQEQQRSELSKKIFSLFFEYLQSSSFSRLFFKPGTTLMIVNVQKREHHRVEYVQS